MITREEIKRMPNEMKKLEAWMQNARSLTKEQLEAIIKGEEKYFSTKELVPDNCAFDAYEEKYGDGEAFPETLERDLSALGEVLESRFVLEDRLIAGLHNSHRRLLQDQAPA